MVNSIQQLSEAEQQRVRKKKMPRWLEPMLARLTHEYFGDDGWIFERKLDGERVLTYIDQGGDASLWSRNRNKLNDGYPEIEEALAHQELKGCILDGEIVAFDSENITDFQRLQPRMQAEGRKQAQESGVKVYYYLFDCLYIDGHEITDCSLLARKRLLKSALEWHDPLRWTPYRRSRGLDYYREACEKGWEGLMAKQGDSSYVHGRSSQWLKFKCFMQQEFVICGFTEPSGQRKGFGALLLGFYRADELIYAGEVGTGFDETTLEELHGRLAKLERKTSPYSIEVQDKQDVHFVTPQLVCEVAFTEWTEADRLRHPRFKGLRRDKKPREVRQEIPSRKAELPPREDD